MSFSRSSGSGSPDRPSSSANRSASRARASSRSSRERPWEDRTWPSAKAGQTRSARLRTSPAACSRPRRRERRRRPSSRSRRTSVDAVLAGAPAHCSAGAGVGRGTGADRRPRPDGRGRDPRGQEGELGRSRSLARVLRAGGRNRAAGGELDRAPARDDQHREARGLDRVVAGGAQRHLARGGLGTGADDEQVDVPAPAARRPWRPAPWRGSSAVCRAAASPSSMTPIVLMLTDGLSRSPAGATAIAAGPPSSSLWAGMPGLTVPGGGAVLGSEDDHVGVLAFRPARRARRWCRD